MNIVLKMLCPATIHIVLAGITTIRQSIHFKNPVQTVIRPTEIPATLALCPRHVPANEPHPEYFCDREAETKTLMSHLKNGRNVTLISPRRLGKTSLTPEGIIAAVS